MDWREKLTKIYILDPRALRVFRILLGFLLFLDFSERLYYADIFYLETGVLSQALTIKEVTNPYHWSLFFLHTSSWWTYSLLALGWLFSVILMWGRWPRVTLCCLWILVWSVHARNPLVLHGGDDLFRVLIFFAIFLPWSGRIKSWLPAFVLMLQISQIYLFTVLYKEDPSWLKDFSALEIALGLDSFSTRLGEWLQSYPTLLKILTFKTLLLESLAVLLIFTWGRGRIFLCLVLVCFHLATSLTLHLGLFPYVCMLPWLLFLPTSFWDKIKRQKLFSLPQTKDSNFLQNSFLLVTIFLVTVYNYKAYERRHQKTPFTRFEKIVELMQLQQRWDMFAPHPGAEDGWFSVRRGGDDLLNTRQGFTPLRHLDDYYPNCMWHQYLFRLKEYKRPLLYHSFLAYMAKVNRVEIEELNFYFKEKKLYP